MLDQYIIDYRRAGVLLDTNLLLFVLLASYDLKFATSYKRTVMYDADDFIALSVFLKHFSSVMTTPQVLGEVWSFVEKIGGPRAASVIASAAASLLTMVESYSHKDVILMESCLPYVGVTDVSVICSAKATGCLVLTDDLKAYNYYLHNDVVALNINHFRGPL